MFSFLINEQSASLYLLLFMHFYSKESTVRFQCFCLFATLCSEKMSRELGDDKKCFLPVSTFGSLLSFLLHGRGDPLG